VRPAVFRVHCPHAANHDFVDEHFDSPQDQAELRRGAAEGSQGVELRGGGNYGRQSSEDGGWLLEAERDGERGD